MVGFPKGLRGLLCGLVALSLLMGIMPAALAREQNLKPVRVGFFAFEGYHIMDESGVRSGYGYDIIQSMLGYTDWVCTYEGYDKSWADMQNMLEKGQIDLVTSAQKTPEREARFDFSELPIGTSAAILTVKEGSIKYLPEDYANWNGMRVGMIQGNSRNDGFANFAKEHQFTYTPVFFSDTDEMMDALREGETIDAVVTSNLRSIREEWILAQFDSAPFYVMVKKGNHHLKAEIDNALERLFGDEPGLRTKLWNQYYTPKTRGETSLTASERAFIQSTVEKPLRALIHPEVSPYSYFEDGIAKGIFGDLAQEVAQRSGLHIQMVYAENEAEYQRLLASYTTDIVFDAVYSYSEAEDKGYRLTVPYFEMNLGRLYKRGSNHWSKAAVVKDSDVAVRFEDTLSSQYTEILYYDTVQAVVQAVASEKADVAYLPGFSAELAAHNDVANRLVAETVYGSSVSYAIAVRSQKDKELFSILNKTAANLSQQAVSDSVLRNTNYPNTLFSMIGYIYDNPLVLVLLYSGLFVIMIFAGVAFHQIREQKRQSRRAQKEKERNQLLTEALERAEQADTAKSLFLSRVSHEMRTPLNAIIGFITLSKDAEPELQAKYLLNSEVAAKQLLAVINDVLDMSAIESGKMRIACAPFDFKQLIQSLTNIYALQCEAKGIAFETRLVTAMDEWLIGDRLRLNQILINLLMNAVKFTETGSVILRISRLREQENKVFLRFEVLDTGCGMTEEMQSRLFRPFEQESAATASKYGGSGLGLSIVKNLVQIMDGAIRVESTVGVGTSFAVDLPFDRYETVLEPVQPEHINMEELRVLAVDDDLAEREYVSEVLKRMGVRYTIAESGKEALAMLASAEEKQESFNVCIVDWKMPEIDGLSLTRCIRERYGKGIVIILLSAYEQYEGDKAAKACGASLFVSKPLFQSTLFDLLQMLCGRSRAEARAQAILEENTLEGIRVLAAEDNVMNRVVVVGLLKKMGVVCETAEDGIVCVDKFTASPDGYYDAILMDIQMPNLDGFGAVKAIRASAHPQAQTIPIIALTANAFSEDIVKTLSGGMNDHVAKPIEPEKLMGALKKACFAKAGKGEGDAAK